MLEHQSSSLALALEMHGDALQKKFGTEVLGRFVGMPLQHG